MKLLITGGSGFIGTAAVQWALDKEYNVINFDLLPPKISSHKPFWHLVDIRNYKILTKELVDFQPTHILHLAANTGMDITNISYFDANTTGVANLINATKKLHSLKRIIFASSLLVCKNGYVPHSDVDYCPPNFYGKSKVIVASATG